MSSGKMRARLVSWFEDKDGQILPLDSRRSSQLWSGCQSVFGTKCPRPWMDSVFGLRGVVQHRLLCIDKNV